MAETAEAQALTAIVQDLPDGKIARNLTIAEARARGLSYAKAAKLANCGVVTAWYVAQDFKDWIAERSAEIKANVLERFDVPTDARLQDASNPDSKTGAQSYLALMEVAGLRQDRGGRIHIGDVNVGTIDGRSITYVNVPTGDVRGEAAQLLSGLLQRCETSGQVLHGSEGADSDDPALVPDP